MGQWRKLAERLAYVCGFTDAVNGVPLEDSEAEAKSEAEAYLRDQSERDAVVHQARWGHAVGLRARGEKDPLPILGVWLRTQGFGPDRRVILTVETADRIHRRVLAPRLVELSDGEFSHNVSCIGLTAARADPDLHPEETGVALPEGADAGVSK